MKTYFKSAVFTCILLACLNQAQAAQGSGPSGQSPLRVEPAVILDNQGFGRPLPAATLFIPYGWKSEGGIEWSDQHACVNGYAFNWSAQDKSGTRGIVALPQRSWVWSSSGGTNSFNCPQARIESAEAYLRLVLSERLPDAKVIQVKARPDLEREAAPNTGVQDNGFQRIVKTVSAAEIIFTFNQQGVALQGSLVTTVLFTQIRTGDQYSAPIHNGSGYASPAFGSYAPAVEHQPAIYEALRRSVMFNPQWEQEIAQHNATMGRIALKGVIERGKIIHQANQEISQIINDTWRAQQKSSDLRAREFLEYIRDAETYSDPNAPGGTVELSSFYNHAWRLEDGTYVLTDDPSFTPYATFGVNGESLSAAP